MRTLEIYEAILQREAELEGLLGSLEQAKQLEKRAFEIAQTLPYQNSAVVIDLMEFYRNLCAGGADFELCIALKWRDIQLARLTERYFGFSTLQKFIRQTKPGS